MARDIYPGSPPEGKALTDVLLALQGVKFSVVNGAAADTNIAVTGLAVADDIHAVLYFPIADVGDANAVTDVVNVTSEVKARGAGVGGNGVFQLETTVTTGGRLLVIWADTSGP